MLGTLLSEDLYTRMTALLADAHRLAEIEAEKARQRRLNKQPRPVADDKPRRRRGSGYHAIGPRPAKPWSNLFAA